ncbi:hypothetical protein FB451DRAFT_1179846 [Mycena latifolia]|nr:hypothetical protein FB451DRAFT_1179846 [Mycena latifolia]
MQKKAITSVFPGPGVVMHDEHEYPHLDDSDQTLWTSSATTTTKRASKITKKSGGRARPPSFDSPPSCESPARITDSRAARAWEHPISSNARLRSEPDAVELGVAASMRALLARCAYAAVNPAAASHLAAPHLLNAQNPRARRRRARQCSKSGGHEELSDDVRRVQGDRPGPERGAWGCTAGLWVAPYEPVAGSRSVGVACAHLTSRTPRCLPRLVNMQEGGGPPSIGSGRCMRLGKKGPGAHRVIAAVAAWRRNPCHARNGTWGCWRIYGTIST